MEDDSIYENDLLRNDAARERVASDSALNVAQEKWVTRFVGAFWEPALLEQARNGEVTFEWMKDQALGSVSKAISELS